MIRINSVLVSTTCDTYEEKLKQIIKKTSLKESDIIEVKVLKRSIDARKKEDIKLNYSLLVLLSPETEKKLIKKGIRDVSLYDEIPYILPVYILISIRLTSCLQKILMPYYLQ